LNASWSDSNICWLQGDYDGANALVKSPSDNNPTSCSSAFMPPSRPRGKKKHRRVCIRGVACDDCVSGPDRDVNAARNILRIDGQINAQRRTLCFETEIPGLRSECCHRSRVYFEAEAAKMIGSSLGLSGQSVRRPESSNKCWLPRSLPTRRQSLALQDDGERQEAGGCPEEGRV